jgi:DNA end-binding protein Ku
MARSAKPKPHVVWKGAVVFGLVNIPVTLYSAARDNDLDFDWLDKRDMAPVGYQRINKSTGKPVEPENIVKGYAIAKGEYVLMSDADFKAANPEATQTVEITAFVEASEITPAHFVAPFFLQPQKRAEKGYALLRDTLAKAGRVGVATVVMYRKQHLAIVHPDGKLLRLNTLRFADEMVDPATIEVPEARAAGLAREREMAARLIDDMTEPFDAERYRNTYRDDLLARIEQKVKSGKTQVLATDEDVGAPAKGAQVIDLMEALKQSLRGGGKGERRPAAKAPAKGRAGARTGSKAPGRSAERTATRGTRVRKRA